MNLVDKKVGIFTITDAINYGAFYQMYAMAKYLESKGAQVTIFHGRYSKKRKLIKYFSPNIYRQVRKLKMLFKFERDGFELKIKEYRGEYLDFAFLGSDEIWNIENKSFESTRLYYGHGIKSKKIIAYAPSIGYAKKKSFALHPHFGNDLANIDKFLVRDASSREVVEMFTNKDVQEVVDPTVLFDDWESLIDQTFEFNENYVLYYGYTSEPPFKDELIKLARDSNLKIVSCGFNSHSWCDYNLTVSPFQFLSMIVNAEFFFTTTFHGTVMASLLGAKFAYFGSGQKVIDYSKKMLLDGRHVDCNDTSHELRSKCLLEHDSSLIRIKEEKSKSREKLDISII